MPALDRDAADVITGSEHILKAYAEKHSLTATAIVDLIKNVLKNPEFNADDVDTNMLQRLQAAIDSGDLQVINMHKDGDGPQVLELFARPVEKVLRELIGDLRLAGHQHFAFHEYKDPHGNRLFAGDAKSIRMPMVTDFLLVTFCIFFPLQCMRSRRLYATQIPSGASTKMALPYT